MEKEIKDKGGEHPLEDFGQSVFFIMFLAVWISDSFFLHSSTFLYTSLPFYLRLSATMILFLLSAFFYNSGHNVTPHHGDRPHVLKTDGAFRYVRHPLYSFYNSDVPRNSNINIFVALFAAGRSSIPLL